MKPILLCHFSVFLQVQLQLLTAIVKLFLKKPTETQELVQQVLSLATQVGAQPPCCAQHSSHSTGSTSVQAASPGWSCPKTGTTVGLAPE